MKRFVIGTAGHIDHGKTRLTQALTGVDTDRLPAEKAQGITIELGFAPLTLPNGVQASIVDVPGHEKFVKTMLAGAMGIDAALLVVAADDGVMPQTREHFDILKLLQIQNGVVALTKADLVGQERLKEVEAQIASLTEHSFLQNAAVIPVSVVTGEGLPELKAALSRLSEQVRQRDENRPARLPVDRVFSAEGQGLVSTGTLVDGKLCAGDTVMIYPQQKTARIRTLQNHGFAMDCISAGSRAAVVLTGTGADGVARGCTVAAPDSMLVTEFIDVYIQITADCPYKIKNSSQLHFYCGTQERICRLRLLDVDMLSAGQSGYAQLTLTKPTALRNGDRFILRFFSPTITIGGGTVLDAEAVRHRRHNSAVLEQLVRLNGTDPADALLRRIEAGGCAPQNMARLAKCCGYTPQELSLQLSALREREKICVLDEQTTLAMQNLREKTAQIKSLLRDWHEDYQLMSGMPLAQLREQAFSPREAAPQILQWMETNGAIKINNGFAALPDFEPIFTQQHKIMQRKLLHYYREAWLFAPDRKTVDEKFSIRGNIYQQVMRHMLYNRMLVPLSPRYAVHHEAYAEAVKLLKTLTADGSGVTLAQFRTEAGISRKYAQLFLEYWDSVGMTRRAGDIHYRILHRDKSTRRE
ncbi:MAG: selenocysteine-specific translation elongation factor [Oscillospiraceae bacterium]|nr:selenocysteine-specific translation elongation factor [Oscillospiraceae bacterium]